MPVNRQTVRELSRTTLYNITSSGQAWRAFLDAAARLYKFANSGVGTLLGEKAQNSSGARRRGRSPAGKRPRK